MHIQEIAGIQESASLVVVQVSLADCSGFPSYKKQQMHFHQNLHKQLTFI